MGHTQVDVDASCIRNTSFAKCGLAGRRFVRFVFCFPGFLVLNASFTENEAWFHAH